jgi:hypothetical protein
MMASGSQASLNMTTFWNFGMFGCVVWKKLTDMSGVLTAYVIRVSDQSCECIYHFTYACYMSRKSNPYQVESAYKDATCYVDLPSSLLLRLCS